MRCAKFWVAAIAVALAVPTQLPAQMEEARSESVNVSAGVVVSVHGEVTIERSGERSPVTEGLVLQEGDVVLAKEGARCTGFTPTGEPFDLPGPGELRLGGSVGEGVLDRVSIWVRRQLTQWIGESRRQPIVTRTIQRDWEVETMTPAPLIPASSGQVRPERAVFYWSSVPGVDRYTVSLVSEDGDEIDRVVRDHKLIVGDLEPGKEYVWKVQPAVDGWTGQAKWRSFRVMLPEEERSLDQALASVSELEAGVLLLSAGLHEEAVYSFDAAVASAEQDLSARRWRAQTMAEIGLYRDAYQDLMRSWEEP